MSSITLANALRLSLLCLLFSTTAGTAATYQFGALLVDAPSQATVDFPMDGAKGRLVITNAGTNTITYTISRSNFAIAKTGNGFTVTDNTGVNGIDTLQNVERLKFSDGGLALDLGATQSAGETALLLGAVLPRRLVCDASTQALL